MAGSIRPRRLNSSSTGSVNFEYDSRDGAGRSGASLNLPYSAARVASRSRKQSETLTASLKGCSAWVCSVAALRLPVSSWLAASLRARLYSFLAFSRRVSNSLAIRRLDAAKSALAFDPPAIASSMIVRRRCSSSDRASRSSDWYFSTRPWRDLAYSVSTLASFATRD